MLRGPAQPVCPCLAHSCLALQHRAHIPPWQPMGKGRSKGHPPPPLSTACPPEHPKRQGQVVRMLLPFPTGPGGHVQPLFPHPTISVTRADVTCMRAVPKNHVFAFVLCSHRKFITLRVLDREEYEKECSFFLVLGDPVWLRRGVKGVRVKTRPSSRDKAAAFSVSPYSHTPFSSLFASWQVCPPSSEAWPLHLFALFPFLFLLERSPSHSVLLGPPPAPRDILGILPC